jgi:hypothetical protein
MIRKYISRFGATLTFCALLVICSRPSNSGQAQNATNDQKERYMPLHAAGSFDVKMSPLNPDDTAPGSTLASMSVDKQYHGDLEATSRGRILTAVTEVKGSAAYVAIERISGKLNGLTGTFVLQHSGTLDRGAQQQSVTVVPDSGTGQLAGITGKMTGTVAPDGKHFYEFEYALPQAE